MSSKKFNRSRVWNKKAHECHWCGIALTFETMTLDHVIPISKGGSNQLGNLVPSCFACNNAKGDLDPIDFALSLNKA